jgi:hypothetical protein
MKGVAWGRSSDGTLTQTGRERTAITVRVGQTTSVLEVQWHREPEAQ